ncbi:hypothetical protein OSSY52_02810 [Tepiditoga spiralis]|uniref:PpiC domain-containing protein n=1 Tax=Tepiditoga spiralis TaxID=2108365 RepID=A0A7G1G1P4_9BACT|nr:peptidylprolyl isomerase [Tepiditoga spiralis]BBE30140.1 hypothetical protein OSSY52_02810 [Tepiditoga spiralis]
MRDWFVKHEKVISFLIVAFFVIGTVAWSISAYISTGATKAKSVNTPTKQNAVAVLEKDGKELDYPYWVMKTELDAEYKTRKSQLEQQYHQQIDPVFDALGLKYSLVNQIADFDIVKYFAEKNHLMPTKNEVKKELENQVNSYIASLKNNQENWDKIIKYYGSEKKVRDLLTNGQDSRVESNLIYNRVLSKVATVTRAEGLKKITEDFDKIKAENEQVNAQHILVSDEATALKIKKMIDNKEISFEDAAAKYSKDTSNATSGGNLGYFGRNKMVKEFEDAAFAATPGVVVGPVKTQFGYHLIKVNDKKVFNKPEDVFLYTDVYSKIEQDLQNTKFKDWLKKYKEDEKFSVKYLDNKYEFMVELSSAATDDTKISKLIDELTPAIFGDDNEVLPEADVELLGLYATLLKAHGNNVNNNLLEVKRFISLQDTDKSVIALGMDTINKKISEIEAKIKENPNDSTLSKEKFKYTDAKSFIEAKEAVSKMNISTVEEAKTEKEKLQKNFDSIQDKNLKVLKDLFYEYPTSNKVVQEYYQINPSDLNAVVQYTKLEFNGLKQYMGYLSADMIKQYFQKQFTEIYVNISNVIASPKASTKNKLDAIDLGIDFATTLKDNNLKLDYLKKAKEIDANYYKDIDKMIAETEKAISNEASSMKK